MMTETRQLITTKDGEKIAVWKIAKSAKEDTNATNEQTVKAQNIFLTHGTFSDKKTCLRIAEYLVALGHHCYIMEWRGHGDSSKPKENFNFETVATYDYEAAFRYLFAELKLDSLHCVTHSGGGVGLTMFLIQNPSYIDKINSISMFACQAYGAALNRKSYAKILAVKLFTRLLGHIPAKKLKLGSCNESYHTMRQWFDWNLKRNFTSSFIKHGALGESLMDRELLENIDGLSGSDGLSNFDGNFDGNYLDYRQHMPMITTPIYSISAKGDKIISPARGSQLFLDDFHNPANVFREYSLSNGDVDDYTHSRIMVSRHAATEIWPTVAAWIEKHAN